MKNITNTQEKTVANNIENKKIDPREKLTQMLTTSPTLCKILSSNAKINHEVFTSKVIATVFGDAKLRTCDVKSIFDACMKSAQLGLPVDACGFAHLVPMGDKVSFQIGFKGYIELVKRNPNVKSIVVETVYEGDDFKYWNDECGVHLKHVPDLSLRRDGNDGFYAVYAIIVYMNGGSEVAVMNANTIQKIKGVAKSTNIWNAWFSEKAKAAAIKRVAKTAALMNVMEAIAVEDEFADTDIGSENKQKPQTQNLLDKYNASKSQTKQQPTSEQGGEIIDQTESEGESNVGNAVPEDAVAEENNNKDNLI